MGIIGTELYTPERWADLLGMYYDFINASSIVYTTCNVSYFFMSVAQIFSVEGFAIVAGRMIGGILIEIPDTI